MTLLDPTLVWAEFPAEALQTGDRLVGRGRPTVKVVQSITALPDRWVRVNLTNGRCELYRRDAVVVVERRFSLPELDGEL